MANPNNSQDEVQRMRLIPASNSSFLVRKNSKAKKMDGRIYSIPNSCGRVAPKRK